ncbi:ABC transporter permease [Jannaschia sp. Os4]|uniref:ABC transporter permease n=1 Tax=Jannaschia sp. Os4 TaxID=2807617 RepID=UPI00193A00C5|nr:ABC transporter permease [Jannaschia sp. Os4]MBM2575608.1 ABC transporter permease [Jannaschia sp. Os4]
MADTSADPTGGPMAGVMPPRAPRNRRLQMIRTIGALMLREMSTTYGKSSLGYFWMIAEPIASIMLLTVVFSIMLRSPSLGDNFPLFYASGVMTFSIWSLMVGKMGQSLMFSRQLISYPGVTYLDALIARFLLTALTQTMVAYIIYGAIIVTYDVDVTLRIEWIALAQGLCFLSAAGLGTLNAFMLPAFPWYRPIYSIIMRPMFLVSTTIYIYEEVPSPYDQWLLINPLVHIIGIARRGFYITYEAAWASPLYVVGLAMVSLTVGLALLRRDVRMVLDR